MESPFPAPGKLIKVKTFLPGAGNEVRAADSRNTLHTLLQPWKIATRFCTLFSGISSKICDEVIFVFFFFSFGVSGHRAEAAQRLQTGTCGL